MKLTEQEMEEIDEKSKEDFLKNGDKDGIGDIGEYGGPTVSTPVHIYSDLD